MPGGRADGDASTPRRPLVLVGLMGSGKTTVGRALAADLRWAFVDNDELLRQVTGRTAAELAARDGADVLHRREAETLLAELDRHDPVVIAAAASVVLDPDVRRELPRRADVVWLQASDAALRERLADRGSRPDLGGEPRDVVSAQRVERSAWYSQVAACVVDTTGRPAEAVVQAVRAFLRRREHR